MLVHVRDGHVAVGLALLDHLEDLLGAGDEPLGGALDVDNSILILVDGKVNFGSCKKRVVIIRQVTIPNN